MRRRRALVVVVVAVLVALVTTAALVLQWSDDGPERLRTDPAAVDDFLQAWERSRRGTYVVVSTFRRSVRRGGELQSQSLLVQRPPDRLVTEFGSITGRLHGRRLSCTAGPDDRLQCIEEGAAPPYEDEVAEELDTIEAYVGVDRRRPLYVVDQPGDRDCFRLRLAIELPNPPWGELARYCFDGPTGAPVRTEIVRREGRDLTEAVSVRREVTDRDLEVPTART